MRATWWEVYFRPTSSRSEAASGALRAVISLVIAADTYARSWDTGVKSIFVENLDAEVTEEELSAVVRKRRVPRPRRQQALCSRGRCGRRANPRMAGSTSRALHQFLNERAGYVG
jgi:hypothetical protein